MCDDRERLIGYVYDECDASERQTIEAHLASCSDCRTEISGLRSVRQDLLAWNVPEHESVWRPFVPVRASSSWRDLPSWGLALAASLLLVAGAAGGVATHALWPHEPAAVAANVPTSPAAPAVAQASLSEADMAALEARVLARVRAQVDEQVRRASTSTTTGSPVRQVAREEFSPDEFAWYRAVNADLQKLNSRLNEQTRENERNNLILTSIMTNQDATPLGGGR